MKRTTRLKMNSVMSLLNRIAILISGLILPRYILLYFGSEVNGLVQSITQFLSIITFLDLGVGSVVQSVLYKPLANKDREQTSRILKAARSFFKKIAYVLIVYVVILMLFYPLIITSTFEYLPTVFLIVALSINLFSQYYFGIVNEILLNADQRGYIQLGTESIVVVLNLLASVFLIQEGYSIQIVKLVSGLIYLLRPLYLTYYVNKHFDLDRDIEVIGDPIPQKWGGIGQHVAHTVQNNTDITVLALFSSLANVSIYSVHNMVVRAIRLLFTSLTAGMTPFFGDLLASEEHDLLSNYFSKIEWLLHTAVTFLFGMTAVLINEFVLLYTSGVTDVDYFAPAFSLLLVIAYAIYSIRTPYRMLVFSAGHYKETQKSSFIEAGLNIVMSLIFVKNFGLVGIAVGTMISMAYQTFYLVYYLSKNIIYRSVKIFAKHLIVDSITFALMLLSGSMILNMLNIYSLVDWAIAAVILGVTFIIMIFIINFITYRDSLNFYLGKLINMVRR